MQDGRSDFFDTSVVINGSTFAMTCGNSPLGVRILYAWALVTCLYNFANICRVLARELPRLKRSRLDLKKNMALRIVLSDLFIGTPMFMAAYGSKLISPNPPVLGRDVFVTVAMSCGAAVWCINTADFYFTEFASFTGVMSSSSNVAAKLIQHFRIISVAEALIYFAFCLGPSVGMLGCDVEHLGPYDSGMVRALYRGNVS